MQVALIFSETAAAAWRAAGSLYDTVSESILRVRFKLHIMASVAHCCVSPTNGARMRVRQGRFVRLCRKGVIWALALGMMQTLGMVPRVDFNLQTKMRMAWNCWTFVLWMTSLSPTHSDPATSKHGFTRKRPHIQVIYRIMSLSANFFPRELTKVQPL